MTEEQERAQRRLEYKIKRKKEDETFDEQNGFARFHRGNLEASSLPSSSNLNGDSNTIGMNNGKGFMEKKDVSGNTGKPENTLRTKRGWIFNILPTVSENV